MQERTSVVPPPRLGARPVALLVGLALVSAALTAAIAYTAVAGDDRPSALAAPGAPLELGQAIATSFGAMAVERVERRPRGATGEWLDVTVAIINLTSTPLPTALGQVDVRRDGGRLLATAPPSGGAEVAARGANRITYHFLLPRSVADLRVELADRAMAGPAELPLGAPSGIPVFKELDGTFHAH